MQRRHFTRAHGDRVVNDGENEILSEAYPLAYFAHMTRIGNRRRPAAIEIQKRENKRHFKTFEGTWANTDRRRKAKGS